MTLYLPPVRTPENSSKIGSLGLQNLNHLRNWFTNAWHEFSGQFKRRKQKRLDRQSFQQLLFAEDFVLEDIGVTRADVEWANKLPISQNAALELHNLVLQNRQVRN